VVYICFGRAQIPGFWQFPFIGTIVSPSKYERGDYFRSVSELLPFLILPCRSQPDSSLQGPGRADSSHAGAIPNRSRPCGDEIDGLSSRDIEIVNVGTNGEGPDSWTRGYCW